MKKIPKKNPSSLNPFLQVHSSDISYLEDEFAQDELPEEQCSIHNDETKLEDQHHQERDGHPVVLQVCPHTSIPLLGL